MKDPTKLDIVLCRLEKGSDETESSATLRIVDRTAPRTYDLRIDIGADDGDVQINVRCHCLESGYAVEVNREERTHAEREAERRRKKRPKVVLPVTEAGKARKVHA